MGTGLPPALHGLMQLPGLHSVPGMSKQPLRTWTEQWAEFTWGYGEVGGYGERGIAGMTSEPGLGIWPGTQNEKGTRMVKLDLVVQNITSSGVGHLGSSF